MPLLWHGKSDRDVYRLLAHKYLRPARRILASIDAFHRERMSGSPIIAVHVRGTDKFLETEDAPTLQAYFDLIEKDAPGWRIFLLSDQTQCVEAFRARYGSRVIFTGARRSSTQAPIHLGRGHDRATLGTDILIDTYLALRCQKFVGLGKSNPSCIVSVLKDWGEGDCTLLGPSLLDMNFARRIGRE